jgi:hypothetical protein
MREVFRGCGSSRAARRAAESQRQRLRATFGRVPSGRTTADPSLRSGLQRLSFPRVGQRPIVTPRNGSGIEFSHPRFSARHAPRRANRIHIRACRHWTFRGWRRRAVLWHVCATLLRGLGRLAHTSRQRAPGRMRHPWMVFRGCGFSRAARRAAESQRQGLRATGSSKTRKRRSFALLRMTGRRFFPPPVWAGIGRPIALLGAGSSGRRVQTRAASSVRGGGLESPNLG